MKILFLDVDGVLNSARNILAFNRFPFPDQESEKELDAIAIGMIRRICEETKTQIIMHSTWRQTIDCIEWGKKWNLPIIGATEFRGISKQMSIVKWLIEHPEVKVYAIIDDQNMGDKNHQVLTDINNGMQWEHAYELLEKLSDKPETYTGNLIGIH